MSPLFSFSPQSFLLLYFKFSSHLEIMKKTSAKMSATCEFFERTKSSVKEKKTFGLRRFFVFRATRASFFFAFFEAN